MPVRPGIVRTVAKGGAGHDAAFARPAAHQPAQGGAAGIDRLLARHKVVALVGPTMPPAWKSDAGTGLPDFGGGAGSLAAVAASPPHRADGLVKGLPVGLSFIGPSGRMQEILSLGFAFEAARGPPRRRASRDRSRTRRRLRRRAPAQAVTLNPQVAAT